MKSLSIITRSALILALTCASLFVTSCASTADARRAQLATWANIAITAAEVGGQINPKQAALIRKGGTLLLDLSAGKDIDIAVLSSEAVAYAVAEGKLTPEQAAALQEAGKVPLTITAPPQGFPEPNPPVIVR